MVAGKGGAKGVEPRPGNAAQSRLHVNARLGPAGHCRCGKRTCSVKRVNGTIGMMDSSDSWRAGVALQSTQRYGRILLVVIAIRIQL